MMVDPHQILEEIFSTGEYQDITLAKTNVTFSKTICGRVIPLQMSIPESFPYKFPEIKIVNYREKNLDIPHIDSNGVICTFDLNTAIPNFFQPKKLTEETLQQAIDVIELGLNGENSDDFIDEFSSYWAMDEKNTGSIISLIDYEPF